MHDVIDENDLSQPCLVFGNFGITIYVLKTNISHFKGSDVYLYPSVLIPLDQLLEKEWAMITLTPVPGCAARSNEACTNDCTR